jgi:hypothetical protein
MPLRERVVVSLHGQGFSNEEINRRMKERFRRGFDTNRIAKLRDHMTELANQFLSNPSPWVAPEIDPGYLPGVEEAVVVADAGSNNLASVDGGTRTVLSYENEKAEDAAGRWDANGKIGGLTFEQADSADSANSRGGKLQTDLLREGREPIQFDPNQIVSGRDDVYGGEISRLADQQRFESNFSEAELRVLRQQSDANGVNLPKIMRELSECAALAAVVKDDPLLAKDRLEELDTVPGTLFRVAAQLGMSIEAFRDALRVADRANIGTDGLGSLMADMITFNDRRQAEEHAAQEDRARENRRMRRKRDQGLLRGVPVRVKKGRKVVLR